MAQIGIGRNPTASLPFIHFLLQQLAMGTDMTKLRSSTLRALAWVLALTVAGAAHAAPQWTGYFSISGLYVSGAENYHLRVTGFTPLSICPSAAFAYVNQSASGSKTYVAALMLAHASAKQVNLFVDGDANGYCRIIEFNVGP